MNIPTPFIIYALPRSRTAWLSVFLSYDRWKCGHDIIRFIHTLDGVQQWLEQPYHGTVETGLIEGWRGVQKRMPYAKTVIVRRNIFQVQHSVEKAGFPLTQELYERRQKLMELQVTGRALVITYDALKAEETCKQLFEYCLETPFDRGWWLALKDANIQVNPQRRMAELERNSVGVRQIAAEMAAAI